MIIRLAMKEVIFWVAKEGIFFFFLGGGQYNSYNLAMHQAAKEELILISMHVIISD